MDRQRTRSMRSLRSVRHMPMIEEQGDSSDTHAPALPEKSPMRYKGLGLASLHENGYHYPAFPPPAYSINTAPDTASASTGKHSIPLKSTKPAWLTRRGGWWRLTLIALAVIACILALVLGLVLGLRRNKYVTEPYPEASIENGTLTGTYSSPGPAAASDGTTTHALEFPAGSYAFNTALANISTSCTSNANTFRCYPFTTYNASGTGAAATFSWTITQVAASPTAQYMISAQANPFVPQFQNISLAVSGLDTESERLTFSFPLNLAITPAAAIDSSNSAATCWFNSTIMSATIYTRRRAEYPANMTSSVTATNPSSSFDPWPFAVEIEQKASSGPGIPDCVNSKGLSLGDFAVQGGQGNCGCVYSNFGL